MPKRGREVCGLEIPNILDVLVEASDHVERDDEPSDHDAAGAGSRRRGCANAEWPCVPTCGLTPANEAICALGLRLGGVLLVGLSPAVPAELVPASEGPRRVSRVSLKHHFAHIWRGVAGREENSGLYGRPRSRTPTW